MSDVKWANVAELEETLESIAEIIREKNDSINLYTMEQMPYGILTIPKINAEGCSYDDIARGCINAEVYLTTNAGEYTFFNRKITKLSGTFTTSGHYAFQNNKRLIEVDLPNFLGGNNFYVFSGCSSLTTVKLPKLRQMSTRYFYQDTSLVNVAFQELGMVSQQCFQGASKLEGFDFLGEKNGSIDPQIMSQAWINTKLDKLIIRSTTTTTPLSNIDAFSGTMFATDKSGGILYVPQSKIDDYKTATNWTLLFGDDRDEGYANNRILAIEGSQYENYYVDGTEIGG